MSERNANASHDTRQRATEFVLIDVLGAEAKSAQLARRLLRRARGIRAADSPRR